MDNNALDINWRDDEGNSHLHLNAQAGNEEVVRVLLDRGCEVNAENNNYETALVCANYNNPRIIELLLNAKASIHWQNRLDQTPLHLAVLTGNLESVNLVLATRGIVRYIGYYDHGKTALNYAVEAGSLEIVEKLVTFIADHDPRYFKTVLNDAVKSPAEIMDRIFFGNEKNLYFAVYLSNTEVARNMIEKGSDVNTQNSEGISILHRAMQYSNSEMVHLLLAHGANVTLQDSGASTPLHWVSLNMKVNSGLFDSSESEKQDYDICRLLLEKGADCNKQNIHGRTPLHLALKDKSLRIVKLMLHHGANISAVDEDGWTALHYAAGNRCVDVIKFILDHGFNIESRTKIGLSALHCAAGRSPEACAILLRRGAIVNSKCENGETPLCRAVSARNQQTIQILLKHGASIADSFVNGRSVLEIVVVTRFVYVPVIVLFLKELAKLQSLNSYISENDRQIIENGGWSLEYQRCLKELEDMKTVKFYENTSFFSLLTESERELSKYARNRYLVQAFYDKVLFINGSTKSEDLPDDPRKSSNVCERFPKYFGSLDERFRTKVQRQRLLDTASRVLDNIFQFNDPFRVVSQKIAGYLDDEDLELLNTI